MFELRENALTVGLRRFDVRFRSHSGEGSLLLLGELFGYIHHDIDKLIASAAVFIVGQTFAAETEHLAGLSAGRDIYAGTPCDSGYFHGAAESSGGDVEHQVVYQVGTVAYKLGMLDFLYYNEEVAGYASALGIVALASQRKSLTLLCTCGNGEGYFLLASLHAVAVAVRAALGDNLTRATTFGALGNSILYAEHGLLLHVDVALSVAALTGGKSHAVFCAGALAVGALHEGGHTECLGHTLGNIFESELYAYAHVAATFLSRLPTPACGTAETAEIKSAELLGEAVEYIVEVEASGTVVPAGTTAEALLAHRVTILVVELFLLFVAEHIVGLGRFLEFLLGLLVAGIAVGVELDGLLAVSLLNLVGSGVFVYAKHLIVITFLTHIAYSPTATFA